MIDVVNESFLKDGAPVRVVRVIPPDKDGLRGLYEVSAEWRVYYDRAMLTGHSQYIEDRVYLAELKGTPVARLWFAWSKRTLNGNFGNIFTNPAHRRRGLLNLLLACFKKDFDACPAKMLCCSASGYRITTYEKFGLNTINGNPEADTMAILKPELGRFADYEKAAYDNCKTARIRDGNPGDQFDCDKFLALTKPVWQNPACNSVVFAGDNAPDFQSAINRELAGLGRTAVAENANGFITGFAYVIKNNSATAPFLTIKTHPDMPEDDAAKLVAYTIRRYRESTHGTIFACIRPDDKLRTNIALANRFCLAATLPGVTIYQL